MNAPAEFETIKQALTTSSMFNVEPDTNNKLVARRRRKFAPRRGAFRLLLPHSVLIVSPGKQAGQRATYLIRPDSLAIFLVVVFLGAIAVEIFMDRATYPREYPPAFVYGFTAYYVGVLIAEITHTKKQFKELLEKACK